jgi:hypothetical protein
MAYKAQAKNELTSEEEQRKNDAYLLTKLLLDIYKEHKRKNHLILINAAKLL